MARALSVSRTDAGQATLTLPGATGGETGLSTDGVFGDEVLAGARSGLPLIEPAAIETAREMPPLPQIALGIPVAKCGNGGIFCVRPPPKSDKPNRGV